jgi:hypothetical protein
MDNRYWLDYVKYCYDLVIESEGNSKLILEHEVEAYVVHLMAKNFNRVDIGENPIAIQILTTMHKTNKESYLNTGDECLLIHSFPIKRSKWPSPTYYLEMGATAYGLANHIMAKHVEPASKIMIGIFNRNIDQLGQILKFNW